MGSQPWFPWTRACGSGGSREVPPGMNLSHIFAFSQLFHAESHTVMQLMCVCV